MILRYHLADSSLYIRSLWYWYCPPRVDATIIMKVPVFDDFSHEWNVFSVLSNYIGRALCAIFDFGFLLMEVLECTLKLFQGIFISLQTFIIAFIS